MKRIFAISLLLVLVGCRDGETIAPPTAIYFGDSISLGIAGPTRYDLRGRVDFRHDAWKDEGMEPSDTSQFYYETVKHGRNNGCSATLVHAMQTRLPGSYYAALVIEIGYHDFQNDVAIWDGDLRCGRIPTDIYRIHMEAAAALAESHAAVVILQDIEPIPALPHLAAGTEVPYNQVLHEIAREHGFYIMEPDWPTQRYAGVHFVGKGYKSLGQQLAECVITALSQEESDRCHH